MGASVKITRSIYIDADLYKRARMLALELGYRSFSEFVVSLIKRVVEERGVDGEMGEGSPATGSQHAESPSGQSVDATDERVDETVDARSDPQLPRRMPAPPCESCEHLRGSYCIKYDKPITRCTECPEMRRYLLSHFRVE